MNNLMPMYTHTWKDNIQIHYYISNHIDENYYNMIINDLEKSLNPYYNTENIPITFYINSFGGDLVISNKLARIILESPVKTIAIGSRISSAACTIFCACKERYLYQNYIFYMHKIAVNRVKDDMNVSKKSRNMYKQMILEGSVYESANIIIRNTNLDIGLVYYLYNESDGYYFSEQEIQKYNIARFI